MSSCLSFSISLSSFEVAEVSSAFAFERFSELFWKFVESVNNDKNWKSHTNTYAKIQTKSCFAKCYNFVCIIVCQFEIFANESAEMWEKNYTFDNLKLYIDSEIKIPIGN